MKIKSHLKAWKLEIEDASSLGGPMGSESTFTIEEKFFLQADLAVEYAQGWKHGYYRPNMVPPLKLWSRDSTKSRSYDASCVIFTLHPITILERS